MRLTQAKCASGFFVARLAPYIFIRAICRAIVSTFIDATAHSLGTLEAINPKL